MIDTTLNAKSTLTASRNYGSTNYMRKEVDQLSTTTPRILLKNNNSILTARNENMPPSTTKSSFHSGSKKFDANSNSASSSNVKQSSNIFSSSLSEFQKCSECDTVRRSSLDEWLNHLGANHAVPSSWPSARASTLDEAKQPHPYTSVVDSHKKRKNDSIPRPLNSFMIFAQYIRRLVLHSFPDAHNVHISQRIGELWRNMPAVLQASFREEASKLAELHAIEFPHYRYQPKKRNRSDSLIQTLPFSVNKSANIEQNENQTQNGNQNTGRSWYYPSENASKWFVDKQMAQHQSYSNNNNINTNNGRQNSSVFAQKRPNSYLSSANSNMNNSGNNSNNNNTNPHTGNGSQLSEKLSANPSILNHNRRPRILIYKNNNSNNNLNNNHSNNHANNSSLNNNNNNSRSNNQSSNEKGRGYLLERRQQTEDNQLGNGKVANFDAPLTALVSNSNKKKNDSSQNLRQNLQINTNSQDSFSSKSTQDYLNNYAIDFAPTMLTTSPEVFMDDSNHFLNSYNFKSEMADYVKEEAMGVEDYHSHQPTGSSSTIECESLTDTFMMKEEVLSPLQSPYENQNSCFSDIDLLESSNLNEIPKANLFSIKLVDENY